METEINKINATELRQLIEDVALIKNILLSEGELTDWAKKELINARNEEKTTSHKELKIELGI